MDTSPKGHARIERDNYFMLLGSILTPGGTDHQTPSDMSHMIVIFPGICPIFLINYACLQFTHKMCSQARKMPDPQFYLLTRRLFFAINRNIRMDLDGLSIENVIVLPILCQLEWFLNHYS